MAGVRVSTPDLESTFLTLFPLKYTGFFFDFLTNYKSFYKRTVLIKLVFEILDFWCFKTENLYHKTRAGFSFDFSLCV